MDVTRRTDDGQAARWKGAAGHAWVEAQAVLDEVLRPFEELLVEAVSDEHGGRVLDVGCGTGGTTLAVARRLGPTSHCVGVDISEPVITAARQRVEQEGTPASFICADAQEYAFEPAAFDTVISRFGVMFFNDPVRAFAGSSPGAAPRRIRS
ncbi:class I SAM-dependent methyltransferase [Streptomyces sp. NPDC051963]|uniref:class I SAM-dependent methyltransferase n=1 Tax=Streptomyces sp. NPDC051963 TaxID=3365678 RepID=UPI0037D0E88F